MTTSAASASPSQRVAAGENHAVEQAGKFRIGKQRRRFLLEQTVGQLDNRHVAAFCFGVGEQGVDAFLDAFQRLQVGGDHAGIGEIGHIMRAGVAIIVEIAESAGAGAFEGGHFAAEHRQAVRQGDGGGGFAGIHRRARHRNNRHMAAGGGFGQGKVAGVGRAAVFVAQNADGLDLGGIFHAFVFVGHAADAAAARQHVYRAVLQFGHTLKLVGRIACAAGQHDQVVDIQMRGAAAGQLDALVLADRQHASQYQVAGLCLGDIFFDTEGQAAVGAAGGKCPLGFFEQRLGVGQL
ncbi:MAG: hypothetical protein Q4G28_03605 [Neisseria sp.]|nr:hypothetical protein [Neisseria sp.]